MTSTFATLSKRFTTAAASIALGATLLGAAAPAEAAVQTCWHLPASGRTVDGFDCNVTTRRNVNGHLVHDITHQNGKGGRFSVVLWQDHGNPAGAEIFVNGQRLEVSWWRDADGDVRLDLGSYGSFVF